MAESIGTAAPMIQAVAGAVEAGSAIGGIFQARSAAEIEVAQLEEEREAAALRGVQEENIRLKRLRSVLATQEAIRAGRGLSLSATSENLRRFSIDEAEKDVRTIRLDTERRVSRAEFDIANAKRRQRGSLLKGIGGAVAGASQSVAAISKIGSRSSTKVK